MMSRQSIEDHRLVVALPEAGDEAQPESLEQLLAGVTADNRHQEVETGGAVGREVW
jgi:antitoxin component of MazEF toxin-antitoxin module